MTARGAGGAVRHRTSQSASGTLSVSSHGVFLGCCCSWCMPCCALTHHWQGYLPLKVLAIAAASVPWCENSIVMRTQAKACSAAHSPPLIAKTAQRHAASPIALKLLCTAIHCVQTILVFLSRVPEGTDFRTNARDLTYSSVCGQSVVFRFSVGKTLKQKVTGKRLCSAGPKPARATSKPPQSVLIAKG